MSDDLERLFRKVLPTLSLVERQALRIIIKSLGRRGSEPHPVPDRPGPPPIRPGAVVYGAPRVMDRIDEDALIKALHMGREALKTPQEARLNRRPLMEREEEQLRLACGTIAQILRPSDDFMRRCFQAMDELLREPSEPVDPPCAPKAKRRGRRPRRELPVRPS